jgi:flavin reductase (DIM6/NTAB) family NADH-FMN oxidoreductase RutF
MTTSKLEFNSSDIGGFEQRYRATFINSLGGYKSLSLIGTRSPNGQSNLAVFNSFFHIGANPPLFGFIMRPDSVERHTLSNILATETFTVNHVREDFYMAAHQTSARYDAHVSEFEAVGLTEEYKAGFHAPFVAESYVKIGAAFRQRIDIALNGTVLILAEILYVSIPESSLQAAPATALARWLSQARDNAQALPTQAQLQHASPPGPDSLDTTWRGSLVLRLPPNQ